MRSNNTGPARFTRHSSRRISLQLNSVLERELATFSSDADRNDLEALLDTYPDAQTREIRAFLARQAG